MRHDRASATARTVAATAIAAAHWGIQPQPTPEALSIARRALRTILADRILLQSVESAPGGMFWRLVERSVAPGFVQHIARRKAWIEGAARKSVASGHTRVVVLGAGLDALGVRLAHSEPRAQVIEFDHPATQRVKRAALERFPPPLPTLIPIDLSHQDVALILSAGAPAPANAPTLVIAEGLLMYLDPDRVDRLLDDLARLTTGPLRLIITFMETPPGERIGFRQQGLAIGLWLRSIREPFRWGATRDEVAAMLRKRTLGVLEMMGERELAKLWPGPVAEGEVLVLAERDQPL